MPAPRTTTLEHPYELLLVLPAVAEACWRKRDAYGAQILLPVDLPGRHLVGFDGAMVRAAVADRPVTLRGFEPGEFITLFRGAKPVLHHHGAVHTYRDGQGPLAKRFVPERNALRRRQVAAAVDAVVEDLGRLRDKYRELARDPDRRSRPWECCPLCHPLPDAAWCFWKGYLGQPHGPGVDSNCLEILGAPLFHDRTGERHWCIKRCPWCGTHYRWAFDYEYLVNGATEDELTLDRLEEAAVPAWVQQVADAVRASQEAFRAEAPPHLDALRAADDPTRLHAAARFFGYAELVPRHDISFALPALIHALAAHPHTGEGFDCAGGWLLSVTASYAERSFSHATVVRDALQQVVPTTTGPEVGELVKRLEWALSVGPRVGE